MIKIVITKKRRTKKMSKFLIYYMINGLLLSWFCQIRCEEAEFSAKLVYELLSMQIGNVDRENKNLKSELEATKAVVERLENKIESMEANVSLIANTPAKYEEENFKSLLNESIRSFEDLSATQLQTKFKTETTVLRKMLVNEKSHMNEKMRAFEQMFNSFKSDLVNNLNAMNTLIEAIADNLEKSISEHNITTITRLVAIEDKLQSQLNETDLLIQEMNEDFENKLTESDKRIEGGNMKLAENINEVDQRLTAAKSNLQSTYSGLNNRLYSAKSVSSSLQSTYSSLNNRLNSAESKLRSVSSRQDRQENKFSGQISALSRRISVEEERKVAFSAKMNKVDSYYAKNERLKFDNVIYSYGGGYSSSTGIFTAPKSGTYLFTYNIGSTNSGLAYVVLMIDGRITNYAIAATGHHISGGNSVIGYVSKGDKVWVQTVSSYDMFYIFSYRTTFNGILID